MRRGAATVLLALGGGVIGYLGAVLVPDGPGWGGLVLGVALGLPLQVAVHELGHVAAGRAAGLRAGAVAVGPFVYQPGRGLRAQQMVALGFAYMLPPQGLELRALAKAYRRMIAGGPMTGLLFSAALLVGAVALPGTAGGAAGVAGVIGVVANVLSIVPLPGAVIMNDGSRFLRLRWGASTAEGDASMLALFAHAQTERPREWPDELVAHAAGTGGNVALAAAGRQLAAAVAVDRGEFDAALAHIERGLDGLPDKLAGGLRLEWAFIAARTGRVAEARDTLHSLPERSLTVRPVTRERTLAAVLLAEGRVEEARAAVARARAVMGDALALPGVEAARLDELEAEIAAAPPA